MSVKTHPAGRRVAHVLLIAGFLLSAPSCSDNSPISQELCVDFTPAVQPVQGRVTAQLGVDSSCQIAEIEIVVTGVDDVFAFTSTITYDIDVVSYIGYSLDGSALQSDGADVVVDIEEEELGTLTVGATRLSQTGVDVVETTPVLKLAFSMWSLVTTSGDFTLDAQCLLGSEQPPVLKAGVACSGGTIAVR